MTERTGIEKELSDLRTEVYEARNLVIKSDNLLRTLHSELKVISKTQERFEKRHIISSVAAYLIFAALAGGVSLFTWSSQARVARQEIQEALQEATAEVKQAEQEASAARETLASRLEAERVASAVYRRISSDQAEEQRAALEDLEGVDMALVPVLVRQLVSERADEVRLGIVRSAWERGRRAYLAERMDEAAEALDQVVHHGRRVTASVDPTVLSTAVYYLGAARNRLGDHEQAVRALRAYVAEEDVPRNTLPYAYLLLGDSLASMDKTMEARVAFEKGLELEPTGRHSQVIRRRVESMREPVATE